MKRVLITDGLMRKSLSAIRSLGSKGIEILVGEKIKCTPASFSRYCTKSFVYPDPETEPIEFYQWIGKTITTYDIDVFFPMDDHTMKIVMDNKESIQKLCTIILPPTESYTITCDKYKTVQLAIESGLDTPKSFLAETWEEVQHIATRMDYPAVIKPRKSSGSRGIRVVHNETEMLYYYQKIHAEYPYPMIQEYIPAGERYDVCLLFNFQHECCASFVQKEIRHFPLEMGPSTVQESVWWPELIQQVMKMMDQLPWIGVIEIEFLIDLRTDRPILMEINPRFWNSLHLAVLSGVDFPYLLYELAQRGDVNNTVTYKVGTRCRSLLPGDLLHFIFNKQRFRLNPSFFLGPKKGGGFDDIISIKDPLPVLGFLFACFRYLLDVSMWKMIFKR